MLQAGIAWRIEKLTGRKGQACPLLRIKFSFVEASFSRCDKGFTLYVLFADKHPRFAIEKQSSVFLLAACEPRFRAIVGRSIIGVIGLFYLDRVLHIIIISSAFPATNMTLLRPERFRGLIAA